MKTLNSALAAIFMVLSVAHCLAQNSMVSRSPTSLTSIGEHQLRETPDEGFLVLRSETVPSSQQTSALVKYDSLMNVEWSRIYLGDRFLRPGGLALTSDGNYLVAATARSNSQDRQRIKLFKVDQSGSLLWSRDFGSRGVADTAFQVRGLEPTAQGGAVVSGIISGFQPAAKGNGLLMEVDAGGNLLWFKSFRVPANSTEDAVLPFAMARDVSGNIFLAGITNNLIPAAADYWVAKFDPTGNLVWSNIWLENRVNYIEDIGILNDSTLVILGNIESGTNSLVAPILMTIDTGGNQILDQAYLPNPAMEIGDFFSLAVGQNKIHIVGRSPVPSNSSLFLGVGYIELTFQLDTVLSQIYTGSGSEFLSGDDVILTSNGPVVLASESGNGSIFNTLMDLGPNPGTACNALPGQFQIDTSRNQARFPLPLEVYQDDSTWVAPFRDSVVNFTANTVCTLVGLTPEVEQAKLNPLFPNPSNGSVSFKRSLSKGKIVVMGINGVVAEQQVEAGTRNLSFPDLPSGLYLLRFSGQGNEWTQKLLIQ